MFRRKNYYLYFLLNCFFISCQPKDSFDWNAGLSAPKYYESSGPFVEYFYQGKSVAGASSGTGADQGWEIRSGGYVGGEKFKPVPDSIFVKWVCAADRYEYEGGSRLPREKMIKCFNKGTVNRFGKQVQYGVITAGMAPGGNITIWLQGGLASTEICKFKVQNKGVWKENDPDYNKYILEHRKVSEGFKNSNIFRYLHGIPYKVWETGEKEYDYDLIFCNEADKTNYDRRITGYSKDGTVISNNSDKTKFKTVKWNERFNPRDKKLKLKSKLPIHIFLQWSTKDNREWCESEIVLPNDFEKSFQKGYFNSKTGKNENYNRIIIGLEKERKNMPFIFGSIWFSGVDHTKEIMRFRAVKFDTAKRKFLFSKYSLPKDYVFPKWEGREPLTKPIDFQYWQEK